MYLLRVKEDWVTNIQLRRPNVVLSFQEKAARVNKDRPCSRPRKPHAVWLRRNKRLSDTYFCLICQIVLGSIASGVGVAYYQQNFVLFGLRTGCKLNAESGSTGHSETSKCIEKYE